MEETKKQTTDKTTDAKPVSSKDEAADVNTPDNGESKKLNISISDLDTLIENDDSIKKWFLSKTDKRVTEGIKTYKENHVKKIEQEIENRIREELLPEETPEQKRIKELERKQAEIERKSYSRELENFAIKYANSLGLERIGDKINDFVYGDEDAIKKRLDWQKERDQFFYDKGKNSFLRENTHAPKSGDEEKLMFSSMKELQAWLQRNPGPENFSKIKSEYYKLAARGSK